MRCIVMANGKYGELQAYRSFFRPDDLILCADGGANYAYELGLVPKGIIGDLDSIDPQVEHYYRHLGVTFKRVSARKDYTDFQLTLDAAREMPAEEIVMLGTLGKRLDHTLANLYAGIELVRTGYKISHYTPECWVHLAARDMTIQGQPGDLVSVLALTEEAQGVTEQGFEYTPVSPTLELGKPYAISNVLAAEEGLITVESGVLAVFHYPRPAGS